MPRIAILTPSLTTGDAVSNDVLGMYATLRELRFETRVYAEGWTLTEPRIWSALKIRSFLKDPDDLLIYHYSRGWDFGLGLLRAVKCRTAIKYHNVTPPEFFEKFNEDLVAMCLAGRKQLSDIARAGCDLYLSASAYNERELLQGGVAAEKSFVVPPFHHIDRLDHLASDQRVLNAYHDGKVNILTVGRLAPNKNHAALIEAFATYHQDYNPQSRLLIVGKEELRLQSYNHWLREVAAHLKVAEAVVFTGEVTDQMLKAYYEVAHVFLMTSEHEGFCVPLVEAMAMRVPVVAYGSSAIPDTIGGVGLVWNERNPYLLAESINSIVSNQSVAESLAERGWRRYEQNFTNEQIRTKFLNAVGQLYREPFSDYEFTTETQRHRDTRDDEF
jgi:glycosyltransferase involved in cell wall biosynthesis